MKICCVADTHCDYNYIPLIPTVDIFIHGGDIDIQNEAQLKGFNEVLNKIPTKYKIVIGGNHDTYLERLGMILIQKELNNCVYLENSGVEIEGIKFWGSPITPFFNNWAFNRERGEEIKKYWNLIPNDVNILLTHGAPYNIMDLVLLANGEPGDHEGDLDLKNRIKELKNLKYHIFGHFHASYGIEEKNNIKHINASLMNEEYKLVKKPIIINI